ncbi:MAG: bifunctional DNA-formamidopyrimidine glycosylase/DNA-(apurinic or apyrimidinic site) lyase [Deinococcota bacterium]|nr:bifunctional DNA-formamidopyrimidine glycosylase/DNA-(apurinic or apyrimidinic site) lyase [Deinococcota bacterium]
MRRELEPWLSGRKIVSASLEDAPPGPKYAGLERAGGQRILSVGRRGKFLILPLDGGDELIIHLGMTGVLTATRPERHLRVSLALDEGEDPALYFQDARRFGRFVVVSAGDYATLPTLQAMGPEPLGDGFTAGRFYAALQASSVALKSYLLSQRPVSGVGNIYADEALWRSRLHPLTPANRVPRRKVPALMAAIREVLEASIAAQGTTLNDYRTVNGEVGAYSSELRAYGKGGEPCPRCGDAVEKIVLAGRGTHYCPRCQRLPGRRPTRPS